MDGQQRRRFKRYGILPERNLEPLFLQTRSLIRILENTNNPRRASDAAKAAQDGLALSLRSSPSPAPLACKRGCSYCCHNWVSATGPEILLIARHIRRNQHRDLESVVTRIVAADELTKGLDIDERYTKRHPCALLEDSLCTVYYVRPNACRSYASLSLPACEASWRLESDDIPVPEHFMILRGAHDQCLWAALKAVGLPYGSYELNHGIRLALGFEDAEAMWLGGNDILAGALGPLSADERVPADLAEVFLDALIAGATDQPLPPRFKQS